MFDRFHTKRWFLSLELCRNNRIRCCSVIFSPKRKCKLLIKRVLKHKHLNLCYPYRISISYKKLKETLHWGEDNDFESDSSDTDSDSESGSDGPTEKTKIMKSLQNRVDVGMYSDDESYADYSDSSESATKISKPRRSTKEKVKQITDDLIVEPLVPEGFSKSTNRSDFPFFITRVVCIYELYKVVHIYLIHLNDYF